jgi:hypothetical protein
LFLGQETRFLPMSASEPPDPVATYDTHAAKFAARYETISATELHGRSAHLVLLGDETTRRTRWPALLLVGARAPMRISEAALAALGSPSQPYGRPFYTRSDLWRTHERINLGDGVDAAVELPIGTRPRGTTLS